MKKVKIITHSNLVAQISAGIEADVIIDNGIVFIAAFEIPSFAGTPTTGHSAEPPQSSNTPTPPPASKKSPVASAPAAKATVKVPTEEEMMGMTVDQLQDMCKDMGIQIPKEGKNTNKKLRVLILNAAPVAESVEEEEEEEEGLTEEDFTQETVVGILEQLEDDTLTEAQAIASLVSMGVDKKEAKTFIKAFMDDEDLDIDEHAATLFEEEEEEEEEAPAPAPKRGSKNAPAAPAPAKGKKGTAPAPAAPAKKSASKKPLTDEEIEELEVGDKLTVTCSEGVYDCEVSAVDDEGTITLFFPADDSEDELDTDYYTKVVRK